MALRESDIAPPDPERYTLDGDEAVEARIARDQALIAAAVEEVLAPPAFRALVLMGGYGRGEGGYVLRDGQPAAYNDYDYFVVVRGLDRARRNALSEALAGKAKDLEHAVGVEVDFALLLEDRLPNTEYSLMNAEMIWGHRMVAGDPDVLDAMPAMPFGGLPAGEFTRLLLNRGALLLMNQVRLAEGSKPSRLEQEVFFKYLFKAVLACGDARLAGNRTYHPSYVKKRELLQTMDWSGKEPFMDLYAQAWENKFHPDYGRYADEDSAAWQERVVRLWLETLSWFEQGRTGRDIGDWTAYCSPSIPKGQGRGSWGGLRNVAITLRDFGPAELLRRPLWALRYPRERLISALPLLLSDWTDRTRSAVAGVLAVPVGTSRTDSAERFLQLWRRYA
jgi:hypothetical protein